MFDIVHQCPVDHPESAGGRILSGEIPVPAVVGTAVGEVGAALEDQCEFRPQSLRAQQIGDRGGQLPVGEGIVDGFDAVGQFGIRSVQLLFRLLVAAVEDFAFSVFFRSPTAASKATSSFKLAMSMP